MNRTCLEAGYSVGGEGGQVVLFGSWMKLLSKKSVLKVRCLNTAFIDV